MRGWLPTDPSTHRISNIPGGYLLDMPSVIPRYPPPALPPSAKDSAPDHGIWVTISEAYGSGDQRAATDAYSWPEICCVDRESRQESRVWISPSGETQVTQGVPNSYV